MSTAKCQDPHPLQKTITANPIDNPVISYMAAKQKKRLRCRAGAAERSRASFASELSPASLCLALRESCLAILYIKCGQDSILTLALSYLSSLSVQFHSLAAYVHHRKSHDPKDALSQAIDINVFKQIAQFVLLVHGL